MADNNHIDVVCFGELLFDIVQGKEVLGGAPMNVAYHLSKLGKTATLISRVGNDKRGRKLRDILTTKGLDTSYLQTDISHQTSIVPATPDQKGNMQYEIVENVAWDYINLTDDHLALLSRTKYFVFGSLAARNDVSKNTLLRLLEAAKNKVLDVNLRSPYFDKKTISELLHETDLLKMNIEELELISGWFFNHEEIGDRISAISEKFSIPNIAITHGEDGALFYSNGNKYHDTGFQVNVNDTIGSGDAFLAGMLNKLLEGAAPQEALRYANGLGAFVASRRGGCPSYTPDDIDLLINKHSKNDE